MGTRLWPAARILDPGRRRRWARLPLLSLLTAALLVVVASCSDGGTTSSSSQGAATTTGQPRR